MKRLVILLICMMILLAACSPKDWINACDTMVQVVGAMELTPDCELCGKRQFGKDSFTGSYEAEYNNFTGTEDLLGGVCLRHPEKQILNVTCTLTLESGSARLCRRVGDETPGILLEAPGTLVRTLEIPGLWNSVSLTAEDFTGSIHLEIGSE